MKSTQIAQWGSLWKHSKNKPHITAHTFGEYSNILAVKWRLIFGCICNQTLKNLIQLGFFSPFFSKTLHWSCRLDDVAQFAVHSTHTYFFGGFWIYFIPTPRKRLIDFCTRCARAFFVVCEPPTGFLKKYLPWVCRESIMIYARRWSICHGFVRRV